MRDYTTPRGDYSTCVRKMRTMSGHPIRLHSVTAALRRSIGDNSILPSCRLQLCNLLTALNVKHRPNFVLQSETMAPYDVRRMMCAK